MNVLSFQNGKPLARACFACLIALALGAGLTHATAQERAFDELTLPRYGGYLPPGGFQHDSGNPWGGYTPFGHDGGWAKLSYGLTYSDFAPSFHFGHNDPSYLSRYAIRPPVRGFGRWNRQGRADDE